MWRKTRAKVPEANLAAILAHLPALTDDRARRLLKGQALRTPSTKKLIKTGGSRLLAEGFV